MYLCSFVYMLVGSIVDLCGCVAECLRCVACLPACIESLCLSVCVSWLVVSDCLFVPFPCLCVLLVYVFAYVFFVRSCVRLFV